MRENIQEQRQEVTSSHSELQEVQKQCRLLSTANAIGGDAATKENAYKRLSYIITQIDKAIATLVVTVYFVHNGIWHMFPYILL